MTTYIEITQSDRATFRLPLAKSKITFGRSSNCDISLPDEPNLHSEHLVIIPYEAGCNVELSEETIAPFSYQGQPLQNGTIRWGEDIFVDKIRLHMVREPAIIHLRTLGKQSIFFALLLLGTSFWFLLSRSPQDDLRVSESVVAPSLFNQPIECSRPRLARYWAREVERTAFAKMQRYPFKPQDGVEAVRLISEARDCYQIAGEVVHVTRVEKALDTWKRRIERDYHNHRLRLRFALGSERHDDARRSIRILRDLLIHRSDPYTHWLNRVEQKIKRPLTNAR